MNWKRTVYCGWCGTKGHNKTTCQHRKDYATNNPRSAIADEIASEIERKKVPRKCSYCEVSGHTRRTCGLLKQDMSLVIKKRKEFIKEYEAQAKKIGLGPGALVKLPAGDRKNPWTSSLLVLVTGYDTNGFDHRPQYNDVTRSYSRRSTITLLARVVSFEGWEDGWEAPRVNQQWNLTVDCMLGMMPEVFMAKSDLAAGKTEEDLWITTTNMHTRLVGPVKNVRFPDDWGELTQDLTTLHRFDPRPSAAAHSKLRPHFSDPCWAGVYEVGESPKYPYEEYKNV